MNKILLYILLFTVSTLTGAPVQTDSLSTEQSPATSESISTTRRSFDEDFKSSYTDNDFRYVQKTKAKNSWDRFWESVNNFLREMFSNDGNDDGINVGTLVWNILAVIIVVFAVYMIVRSLLGKENTWIFGKSRKAITVQDITEQELEQMDLPKLIEKTKSDGNYRLAIRYYYLWLLKKLSAREIIKWHPDKTNSEYGYEINNDTLRKEFNYLSYVYDYSWYGEFTIDEAAYTKAEKAFLSTIQTI